MKRYQVTLADQTFDVKVLSDPNQDQVQVEVNGRALTVSVKAVEAAAEAAEVEVAPLAVEAPATPSARAAAANVVTSPLPGVIKSVMVREGQQVAYDDELIVIEAMKMDNVIRARREGIVAAIHVSQGSQVSHGEILLAFKE